MGKEGGQQNVCLGLGPVFRSLADRVPWEAAPEGQRRPGRLDILQERNPKGAEQASSMCQRMSLTQWVRLVWLNYKDVVRLQREKIRGVKAQLGLNLAIAVEGAHRCP